NTRRASRCDESVACNSHLPAIVGVKLACHAWPFVDDSSEAVNRCGLPPGDTASNAGAVSVFAKKTAGALTVADAVSFITRKPWPLVGANDINNCCQNFSTVWLPLGSDNFQRHNKSVTSTAANPLPKRCRASNTSGVLPLLTASASAPALSART